MPKRQTKITLLPIAIFSTFILLTSCTNKGWYHAMQENRKQECNKQPTLELQQACREELGDTYEEYERKRQEAIEEK